MRWRRERNVTRHCRHDTSPSASSQLDSNQEKSVLIVPQTTPTTRQVKRAAATVRQAKTTQQTTGMSPLRKATKSPSPIQRGAGEKKAASPMQRILRHPLGRIAVGLAALLVVVVGAVAFYVFGG